MKNPQIQFSSSSEGWNISSYNEIGENFKYGLSVPAIPFDGENKYLRITDIDDDTRIFDMKNLSSPGTDLSLANEYILTEGDITFARTGASVGKSYLYDAKDGKIYFAGFLIKIGIKKNVCASFIFQNSLTNNFKRYINLVSQRSGQPGINIKELQAYKLYIPKTLEEQQKIASYFKSLDSLIQTTSKKLVSLKQIKDASLQSMFPQEGETVPKVRFKGFEGEWEKEKLGKLFKERIENNINGELLSVTINNGIIKASENGRFDNSNNDKSHYKVVKIGDIVYNTMRMWQGASGYSAYEGIVSPAYTVIIPQEQVFPLFFAYMFKTQSLINRFRIYSQGLTTDTWNLKFTGFSGIEVCFPKSKLEQQKIASYFYTIVR